MPRVWRLARKRPGARALDGEGAKLYGGRWNQRGTPAIYTASTISLAALEILVHLEDASLLRLYTPFPIDIPEDSIEEVPTEELPEDWRESPVPLSCQELGSRFLEEGRSLALKVPSVVIPLEANYVLNPAHPALARAEVGEPAVFVFDPRLLSLSRERAKARGSQGAES